jgi:hypothetical protein
VPIGKAVWLHFRYGGTWTVYVDQVRRFSAATKPQLRHSFAISRRFVCQADRRLTDAARRRPA